MERKWVGFVAAVILSIPGTGIAQTVDSNGHQTLAVRTFNYSGASAEDVRKAEDQAGSILRTAGIELSWVECWEGGKAPAGVSPVCRMPVGSHDVILRIQPANAASGRAVVSMGFSLVNTRDDVPHLSTIYADQVSNVARHAGVDVRTLLGRAIAHEIGHLLLDSNSHSKAGLMREVWSQSELRRDRVADWQFREEETALMHAALSSRTVTSD